MRIGIVSQWRNQGQATLSRHLRDALDSRGHETFVLARPTRDTHALPGVIDRSDVWDQPGVEDASSYDVPEREYLDWARDRRIEACFFNQNYQFDALEALRRSGVRTIGYFVWESFRSEDLAPARRAYDVVYSLNRATRDRYRRLGLDSPLLPWGIHPELLAPELLRLEESRRDAPVVRLFFPGGMQGPRKPLRAVVEAFRRAPEPRLRLVLKAQGAFDGAEEVEAGDDPRVERIVEDLSLRDYHALFASCHVCLGVSRWEGTGLHFYEATAFGMPMITNDVPPMNELFEDGDNARLVKSHVVDRTRSGIPAVDPDVADLARAIQELAGDEARARLAAGARRRRDRLPWERVAEAFDALLRNGRP